MRAHSHPKQEADESDINFIVRSLNWLAEPDRRRMSVKHRDAVIKAVKRLDD